MLKHQIKKTKSSAKIIVILYSGTFLGPPHFYFSIFLGDDLSGMKPKAKYYVKQYKEIHILSLSSCQTICHLDHREENKTQHRFRKIEG